MATPPLFRLTADQYGDVKHLFVAEMPNLVMARAVLLRNAPGNIWTDDKRCVSLVKTAHWCLLAGAVTEDVFAHALKLLQDDRPFSLVVPSDVPWARATLRAEIDQVARRHFTWPSADVVRDQHVAHLEKLNQTLPAGYRRVRLDAALVPACAWEQLILRVYGSADLFLNQVEAYVLFTDEVRAELCTITADAHQGRGLSKALCAAVAQECLHRGLRPTWSCHADNPASANVAIDLGLAEDPPYTFAKSAT
jgi:GNAT superfamily N-acetyltransferase